jgi:FdhD protein
MPIRPGSTASTSVWDYHSGTAQKADDLLATEEPLEIRLVTGGKRHPVAVTMRTPGADFELAAGFLFTEGVVASREQIRRISYCVDSELADTQRFNVVNVELARGTEVDLAPLERHFSVTSACGVCGKTTLEALRTRGMRPPSAGPYLSDQLIRALPEALRGRQEIFDLTGGLHASGLFTAKGELVALREDVGRHNAMDKLVGWALLQDRIPLEDHIVVVSGRASFELVQKAVSAGLSTICSVSAPSSLAVDVAREFGMTLVGFLRVDRFKVYSGIERFGTGGT